MISLPEHQKKGKCDDLEEKLEEEEEERFVFRCPLEVGDLYGVHKFSCKFGGESEDDVKAVHLNALYNLTREDEIEELSDGQEDVLHALNHMLRPQHSWWTCDNDELPDCEEFEGTL